MLLMGKHDVDGRMETAFTPTGTWPMPQGQGPAQMLCLSLDLCDLQPSTEHAPMLALFFIINILWHGSLYNKALKSWDYHLCITLVFTVMSVKKKKSCSTQLEIDHLQDKPLNIFVCLRAFIIKFGGRNVCEINLYFTFWPNAML